MKDILVVGKLKDGAFEKFMGFMQSDEGMAERKKVADVTKTIASVSPDKSTVMFKIVVHDMTALHSLQLFFKLLITHKFHNQPLLHQIQVLKLDLIHP